MDVPIDLKEYAGYFWQRRHNKDKRYYTLISGKRSRGVPEDRPCEMPEPYDGKLSRTVLRGERG